MIRHFFGGAGKPPDRITSQDVFAWAYTAGLSGKQPSQVTIGARIACLSSFYRFLIRMEAVTSNPCDALERPKVSPALARGTRPAAVAISSNSTTVPGAEFSSIESPTSVKSVGASLTSPT